MRKLLIAPSILSIDFSELGKTLEKINDSEAVTMCRDIRKKIEEGMEYPGQIKVTVIREMRTIEYAK